MIVVYGIPSEPPIALVLDALVRRGIDHVVVSQRSLSSLEWSVTPEPSGVEGWLRLNGTRIELNSLRGIYARPIDYRSLPEYLGAGASDVVRKRIAASSGLLRAICNHNELVVVNRPRNMFSNNSKSLQSQLIRAQGFSIPRTVITNDLPTVLALRAECEELVYKSISGQRSIVQRLTDDDLPRLTDIKLMPVQFQELVRGTDVRVHVIGERVLSCAIIHRSVDYRYPGEGPPARCVAISTPPELAERCRALAHSLGLLFAGIDLRVRDDGLVYCFEVNPSPGFSYYEEIAGQPIANAVVDLLAGRR
jgi:glutathione synthase/RimK-type ligase-like ATP-grasp enzyme